MFVKSHDSEDISSHDLFLDKSGGSTDENTSVSTRMSVRNESLTLSRRSV